MNKRLKYPVRFAFTPFIASLALATVAAAGQLNVFTWSEYLPTDVVADFEKRFDCKVVVDFYDSPEAMLTKIQSGGSSLYDVVIPSDETMATLIGQNLLTALDHKKVPNVKNIEDRFLNRAFDPGNRFSVPYQWGTLGILARTIPGQPLEQSWSLFLDPKKQPGPILLLDSPSDMIRSALKFKGYDFNSTNPKHLKEVRDLLADAKKRSLGFANTVAARKAVLDKTARAAIVYSGDGIQVTKEDPAISYFIPREGSLIFIDSLVILRQAPHPELAHNFINYILEPEVGARISNTYLFATPNREAKKFVRSELLTNTVIYPSEETMRRLEFAKHLGREARLYDQVWTSVKAQ
jgi:spermidine/putrescine transport system substrate-binding protein